MSHFIESHVVCLIPVFVLLPILATGSTVQQELPCTDSYAEFERASVGSNSSGFNTKNQLYTAFYPPNQHLPYSVLVTYQLVLANGTRFNLSSDQTCDSELWMWASSPVFLLGDSTYLNRLVLFTLNYFIKWDPPHITITMVTAPCHTMMKDFLSEMTVAVGLNDTQSLISYSINVFMHITHAHKTNKYIYH